MGIHKYATKKGDRWRVNYRRPDGQRSTKRGFTTKSAARAWKATTESKILTGKWIDDRGGNALFSEVGDKWINSRGHLKPSSFVPLRNAYDLRVRPRFGNMRLNDIKHSDIVEWVQGLQTMDGRRPLAATGRRYALQVVSNVLEMAVKDGLLPSNPARGVPQPKKGKKPLVFLTAPQLHALANHSGEYRLLVLLLGYTGLRWGEAIALTGDDVNLVTRRISITKNVVWVEGTPHPGSTKTGEDRTVPIPQFLVTELTDLVATSEGSLLWAAPTGGYLHRPPTSRGWFQQAVKSSGVPRITPHDLRHTAASLAVHSGANVKAVQKMLGHASAAMTLDVYASLFDDDLDEVAQRMDEEAKRLKLV